MNFVNCNCVHHYFPSWRRCLQSRVISTLKKLQLNNGLLFSLAEEREDERLLLGGADDPERVLGRCWRVHVFREERKRNPRRDDSSQYNSSQLLHLHFRTHRVQSSFLRQQSPQPCQPLLLRNQLLAPPHPYLVTQLINFYNRKK